MLSVQSVQYLFHSYTHELLLLLNCSESLSLFATPCSVIWSALFFTPGLCRRRRSFCWATWTPCTCIRHDCNTQQRPQSPTSLWLEVNWQKTKVQARGSREYKASTITAQRQEVAVVEEFVYLGSLMSYPLKALPISRVVMPSLVQLCRTWTVRYGSHKSPHPPSWSCTILAFYPSACMVLSAGQLPRGMYTRQAVGNQMVPPCAESWRETENTATTSFGYCSSTASLPVLC